MDNWLNYAKGMANALGLKGWKVKAYTPAGMTRLGNPDAIGFACPATKTIGLSKTLLLKGCAANIKDTIHHEIAHAIADIVHGTDKAPHGKHWKDIAKTLGATPTASGLNCDCCWGIA